MAFVINEEKAKDVARRFLGQYYNVVDTEAILEDKVWLVTAHLGFATTQKKTVKVDADSGKILGYT